MDSSEDKQRTAITIESHLTDSISLELSEDSPIESEFLQVQEGKTYRSEQEFQEEIDKLKIASNKKFLTKWEEILQKYSQIDDDVESDEIDLVTGQITIDNGHLRSLRNETKFNQHRNVWSVDYDAERDRQKAHKQEKRLNSQKNKVKEHLKAQDLFISSSSHNYRSPIRKVSPDNILLLDPSPTKKQKLSPTKTPQKLTFDVGSPSESVVSDSEDSLIELQVSKTSTPTKPAAHHPFILNDKNDLNESSEEDVHNDEGSNNQNSDEDSTEDNETASEEDPFIDKSTSLIISKRDLAFSIRPLSLSDGSSSVIGDNEDISSSPVNDEFEEEYSIVNNSMVMKEIDDLFNEVDDDENKISHDFESKKSREVEVKTPRLGYDNIVNTTDTLKS
ncbi:hypothetical protein PSN45_003273 [Yamadazyma tenuis]|uniref:uncharacterized protein n=1 Tax=Candida tenuis TaxID=2315449 RepID=UPI0027A0C50B|nr:hypothetical protein PSN45_003273 [Yamadazyma tenuis]